MEPTITLELCRQLFLADLERRVAIRRASPNTLKVYRSSAKLVSAELLARPVAEIRRRDVRAWHLDIAQRTRKGRPLTGAADAALAALAAIFCWAMADDVADIEINPCHGVRKLHTHESARALSDVELEDWRRALDVHEHFRTMKVRGLRDGHERMRSYSRTAALRLLDLTGARCGEIRGLLVEHIDLERRVLLLEGTKTDKGRARPLSGAACDAIRRQLARLGKPKAGWLFPGKGDKPVSATSTTRTFADICEIAGIVGASPHSLRHTMITRAFDANLNAQAIGAAAGQISAVTWTTYRHCLPPDAFGAVEVHARRGADCSSDHAQRGRKT